DRVARRADGKLVEGCAGNHAVRAHAAAGLQVAPDDLDLARVAAQDRDPGAAPGWHGFPLPPARRGLQYSAPPPVRGSGEPPALAVVRLAPLAVVRLAALEVG